MTADEELTRHDAVLLSLVAMLQDAGMRQLGKLVHPVSGKLERDLEGARATIDILEMLQAKCRSATPGDVMRALDTAVLDLQMNWLDESRRGTADRQGGEPEKAAGAGTEAAP